MTRDEEAVEKRKNDARKQKRRKQIKTNSSYLSVLANDRDGGAALQVYGLL